MEGKTHESKRVNGQSADGVGKQTQPKDIQVENGHQQIPDKVTAGHSLDHARGAGIPPDALLEVGIPALIIDEDDPQREAIDQGALDQRDDVGVPVDLLGPGLGVVLRDKPI